MNGWRVVYTGLLYVLIPLALLRLMWRARRQRGQFSEIASKIS